MTLAQKLDSKGIAELAFYIARAVMNVSKKTRHLYSPSASVSFTARFARNAREAIQLNPSVSHSIRAEHAVLLP